MYITDNAGSEICGVNHGFMPIVVKDVVPGTYIYGLYRRKIFDITKQLI